LKSLTIVTLALAALLAGCASSTPKPYVHNPKLSEALNLAEAARIYGLKDIPADKAYRARGSGTGLAGAAVVGALDAGNPLPGFSALGGGVMGFLSMAIPPPQGPGAASQIVAFVPKSIAPDMDTASKTVAGKLNPAIEAVMKEVPLPAPFRYGEMELTSTHDKYGFRSSLVPILGMGCGIGETKCEMDFFVPARERMRTSIASRGIRDGFAPQAFGGEPAWSVVGGIFLSNSSTLGQFWREPLLPEFEFYQKVSERLPPWMYLYIAPGRASYRKEDGTYAWLPAPAILHQGRILPFVEPREDQKTAEP